MLLPSMCNDPVTPCLGAILFFEQERDMPHGVFGDRDAGHEAPGRPLPPACGLFGRMGDDPPLTPANDSPIARAKAEQARPRGDA